MQDHEILELGKELDNSTDLALSRLRREILPRCADDLGLFCKLFFPRTFSRPFEEGHQALFDLVDWKYGHPPDNGKDVVVEEFIEQYSKERKIKWRYQKAGATMFRGAGKSVIISMAMPAREILFRQSKFFIYMNNSSNNAVIQTDNLKRELVTNRRIKAVFGTVKPSNAGIDESFGKQCYLALDTFVLPRGSEQAVRGSLFNSNRPDLIVVDDLEDANQMGERIRKRRENRLFSDLFMSIDPGSNNWRFFYTDTLKHRQAIPNKLKKLSDWKFINLPICTDDFKTNFPTVISQKKLDRQVAQAREAGTMYLFYREKMGKIVHGEEQVFKPEYFKYYSEFDSSFNKELLQSVVIVDPAKTTNLSSADSAIVGLGVDTRHNRIYVRDIAHGKFHPDEIYRKTFEMAVSLKARTIGYEVTGLNEFITHPFLNAMHESGKNFEMIELKPRRGKEEYLVDLDLSEKAHRVGQLLPYYRKGQIIHNRDLPEIGALESQLLDFPEPDLWDICDALSYVIPMMETGLRYFSVRPDQSIEDDYDEFAILENGYEPALDKSWFSMN